MKKYLLVIIALFVSVEAMSQHGYTVERCWQKARDNYENVLKYNLIKIAEQYSLVNASQEVHPTSIPIVKSVAKHTTPNMQNSNSVINSILGNSDNLQVGASNTDEVKRDEHLMYELNYRVNAIYFSIILLQNKIKYTETFQLQMLDLKSALLNLKCDKELIDSYIADLEKYQHNLSKHREILVDIHTLYLNMLSALIGEEIDHSDVLQEPEVSEYVPVTTSSFYLSQASNRKIDVSNVYNNEVNMGMSTTSKESRDTGFNDLRKSMFNINIEEHKSAFKLQIDRLRYELESTVEAVDNQVKVIVVSFMKLENGTEDMRIFLQRVAELYRLNHKQVSHMVQLMLEVNQYLKMYQ